MLVCSCVLAACLHFRHCVVFCTSFQSSNFLYTFVDSNDILFIIAVFFWFEVNEIGIEHAMSADDVTSKEVNVEAEGFNVHIDLEEPSFATKKKYNYSCYYG